MFRYSLLKNLEGSSTSSSSKEEETKPANKKEDEKSAERCAITTVSDEVFLLRRGYFLMSTGLLGEGTYSKVKRAYSKYRGCDVAIKIVNRKIAPKDFLKRFLPRELEIIGQIKHQNICEFFEVLDIGEKVFIVMQHAPRGDLLEYIQRHKFLKEDQARKIFVQVRILNILE